MFLSAKTPTVAGGRPMLRPALTPSGFWIRSMLTPSPNTPGGMILRRPSTNDRSPLNTIGESSSRWTLTSVLLPVREANVNAVNLISSEARKTIEKSFRAPSSAKVPAPPARSLVMTACTVSAVGWPRGTKSTMAAGNLSENLALIGDCQSRSVMTFVPWRSTCILGAWSSTLPPPGSRSARSNAPNSMARPALNTCFGSNVFDMASAILPPSGPAPRVRHTMSRLGVEKPPA